MCGGPLLSVTHKRTDIGLPSTGSMTPAFSRVVCHSTDSYLVRCGDSRGASSTQRPRRRRRQESYLRKMTNFVLSKCWTSKTIQNRSDDEATHRRRLALAISLIMYGQLISEHRISVVHLSVRPALGSPRSSIASSQGCGFLPERRSIHSSQSQGQWSRS